MDDQSKHINIAYLHAEADAGFRKVFNQYYQALCFFVEKLVVERAIAEDIVEDTFIKLWEKQPDFSKHKNIKAVLYIAVKNASLNFLKAQRKERLNKNNLTFFAQRDSENSILNEITRAEVLHELYAELQKLPPERRRVMNLLFVEGWDSKKVAEHLNISIHTVKKHKLNGIHTLQKKLGISSLLLLLLIRHL